MREGEVVRRKSNVGEQVLPLASYKTASRGRSPALFLKLVGVYGAN